VTQKKKLDEIDVTENPLYHDTWKLLKKYRDVVWSLELSVQHVRNNFRIEYGSSIEDFLDSIYLAGINLSGSDVEHQAKCIEHSHKMLKLMESAVELLRNKHKCGEVYYWILNLEDNEAQRVQSVLNLSEAEVMEITHFERGSGLISTNNNNIAVEFKASQLEKDLITTDRRELQELLARTREKAGV